jgi:hypothetical protein
MSETAGDPVASEGKLVSVPEMLTTVSHEVRVLSDSVIDLQDLVGNLVVAGAFGGSPSIYELQCLDRISQGLEAISDYLKAAAGLSQPEWKIDGAAALSAVKLAEISERLSGIKRKASEGSDAAGDFEDFALTG